MINVDLETIIRENSWRLCDKCDYKSKSRNGIKIHKAKMHTKTLETQTDISEVPFNAVREKASSDSKLIFKELSCEICEYTGKDIEQINIHIYMKYYTGIRGKFRCKLCKKNGLDSEEALEFHIKNVHNMSEEYITKIMKLLLMNNSLKLDSNGTLY